MKIMRSKRYIMFFLIITFISSIFIIGAGRMKKLDKQPLSMNSKQSGISDRKTAEEISNMTGITVEDILKLKGEKKTWNAVLEYLRNNKDLGSIQSNNLNLLSQIVLGNENTRKLMDEGYSVQDIMEVKMLIERVAMQLRDITMEGTINASDDEEEDISLFEDLNKKMDENSALYITVKIKKNFNDINQAFDEYLLSLQLDLKMENYIDKFTEYQKQKENRLSSFDISKAITISKIEDRMILKLTNRSKNTDFNPGSSLSLSEIAQGSQKDMGAQVVQPDWNKIQNPDPLGDAMDEINRIKDDTFNYGTGGGK